jgi:hypothetical protein
LNPPVDCPLFSPQAPAIKPIANFPAKSFKNLEIAFLKAFKRAKIIFWKIGEKISRFGVILKGGNGRKHEV